MPSSKPEPWTNQYIGIPFVNQGRRPEDDGGLDCWGLARLIWKEEYNLDVPSYLNTYNDVDKDEQIISRKIMEQVARNWHSQNSAEAGDGVVIRLKGIPLHVGVMASNRHFVHVFRKIDTTLDKIDSPRWKRRIIGFYRHESML